VAYNGLRSERTRILRGGGNFKHSGADNFKKLLIADGTYNSNSLAAPVRRSVQSLVGRSVLSFVLSIRYGASLLCRADYTPCSDTHF